MKYEMDKNNIQDWLNKGSCHNTSICLKMNVSMFEDFITHARTDRYNIMCYLVHMVKRNQIMKMMKAV